MNFMMISGHKSFEAMCEVDRLSGRKSGSIEIGKLTKETESMQWDHFRKGNDLSFAKIYQKYVNLLFNYGRKFCKDTELIRDCLQDFFIYLREHRDGLGPTTSIKFYLLRSFRRRLLLQIEKSSKNQFREFGDYEFEIEIEDCDVQQYINAGAKEYLIKKLNKMLANLAPKQREAIYFYYYEGMSYSEIAEVMQYSQVSSARRLVYSALGNLRVIFGDLETVSLS